jgi:hypothetical protein
MHNDYLEVAVTPNRKQGIKVESGRDLCEFSIAHGRIWSHLVAVGFSLVYPYVIIYTDQMLNRNAVGECVHG